jgi:indolepyruvate ferredoxin oxidoreductase beta subunit
MDDPTPTYPITLLVCALGGEGGGVMAEWLVEIATACGHSAQSTSIPGVAQRTGATTYYIEVWPQPDALLGGRRPVFGLSPVPGGLDVLVSSELLETARQVGAGLVSRERTLVLGASGRTLTTAEKLQPADGRYASESLREVIAAHSRELHLIDVQAIVQRCATLPGAVLLGALAASGALPFERAAFESVMRASGKGVEASLRGFDAAYASVATSRQSAAPILAVAQASSAAAQVPALSSGLAQAFPADVHEMLALGHVRLREYQDEAYAALYVERLQRVLAAERHTDGGTANGHATTREVARWLALWMAFDDIVRVAELKSRASRHARVRREVGARTDELLRVHDFFKPGVAEFAALLPARLAAALRRWERRRVARGLAPFALPIKLASHSVSGMLALRALAACKRLRRIGSRYAEEQTLIERWLAAVEHGARTDWALGHEIALAGRLIKGYGSTHERGKANLLHVVEHLATGSDFDTPEARAAAIRAVREAALADDAGTALDRALAQHGAAPRPVPEQPIRWVRQRPSSSRPRPHPTASLQPRGDKP